MVCLVRRVKAGDKPDIMRLLRSTPEFEPEEVPIAEEVLDGSLERPGEDYQTLVAEKDGTLAGYICFGQTPLTQSVWDIYWMAVSQDCRGQGIGSTMLKKAEEHIKNHAGSLILIETSSKPSYLLTRRFYRKSGYKQVSRIKNYYAPGDHRITFEKRF
jgi:ribosomal protein S18 acetylase RimI-like enzyme